MRIVCLDYGTKRIGVAVSDELGLTAQPWTVLNRRSHAQDMEAISEVLRLTGASCVVVGLPRNMNGSYGDAAEKVREFAQAIERATGVTTVLYDERMSTAIAERMLIGADVSRKRRRRSIDMLAAQVILQDYLDLRGKRCPGQECVDSSLTGGLEYAESVSNEVKWMTEKHDPKEPEAIDEREDTIVLTDEDGVEHVFEIVEFLEVNDKEYAVLLPEASLEDDEDDEAIILRIEEDDEGNTLLVEIEDDEEWDAVEEAWEALADEDEQQ